MVNSSCATISRGKNTKGTTNWFALHESLEQVAIQENANLLDIVRSQAGPLCLPAIENAHLVTVIVWCSVIANLTIETYNQMLKGIRTTANCHIGLESMC